MDEVFEFIDQLRSKAPNVVDGSMQPMAAWPAKRVARWVRAQLLHEFPSGRQKGEATS